MAGNMIHLEGLQKEVSENELFNMFSEVPLTLIQIKGWPHCRNSNL